MDWKAAKEHLDAKLKQYLDLDGIPGVNVSFALKLVLEPLNRRYNQGERTPELYDEIMAIE